jgi:hypothetical protein
VGGRGIDGLECGCTTCVQYVHILVLKCSLSNIYLSADQYLMTLFDAYNFDGSRAQAIFRMPMQWDSRARLSREERAQPQARVQDRDNVQPHALQTTTNDSNSSKTTKLHSAHPRLVVP